LTSLGSSSHPFKEQPVKDGIEGDGLASADSRIMTSKLDILRAPSSCWPSTSLRA